MSTVAEKERTKHNSNPSVNDETQPAAGFTANLDQLPKGYFKSPFFVGTLFAIGTGLAASTGGYGLAAPNLTLINNEIGPDPSINWISFVYTLTLSVGLLIFGRLTDVFGRYYLIGGTVLSLVGCIVAATAQNVPALIVGMALVGLGGSAQQSFSFVSNELVPMKYRFIVNSWIYLWTLPTSAFGAAISKAFVLYTAPGWRWCYYYLIIFNVISLGLYVTFYFPPTFAEKHTDRTKTEAVRMFDYIGTFLFIAGLVLFQLGLLWGGQWKSVPVIVTIVLGAIVLVAFSLWEAYAPLKEPVVPIRLFKNIHWVSACVLLGLGASIYYAMAIIWPNMVSILYTDDGGASMTAGWLNSMPVTLMVVGQILGGGLAAAIGKQKYQCMFVLVAGGALLAAMAYSTPSTLHGTAALLNLSCFLIGWNESVCLTNAGIELEDQREIGTAVGMAGSIRSTISTVASSVYVVVLNNRMAQTIPTEVPPVLIEAGLPQSSVAAFLEGLSTGSFNGIQGLTPHIQEVGVHAYKVASSHAFKTVYLTSIAFTGVAIILSFWAPTVDDKLTGQVAATLHQANTAPNEDEVAKA
ncbi:fungal trichothecene efflux pump [Aspergillus floccosus]